VDRHGLGTLGNGSAETIFSTEGKGWQVGSLLTLPDSLQTHFDSKFHGPIISARKQLVPISFRLEARSWFILRSTPHREFMESEIAEPRNYNEL
jgi:hypothetical protein